MNIFVLSESPFESGVWQHDRHVVKMTLESCQMLSTAIWTCPEYMAAYESCYGDATHGHNGANSETPRLYKSTHVNHPCNIWLRESPANFFWLVEHLNALIGEYGRRFHKPHGCDSVRWTMNTIAASMVGLDRYHNSSRVEIRPGKWNRKTFIDPKISLQSANHTPFAVCMPDAFRVTDDPIASYRKVYLESKIFHRTSNGLVAATCRHFYLMRLQSILPLIPEFKN